MRRPASMPREWWHLDGASPVTQGATPELTGHVVGTFAMY